MKLRPRLYAYGSTSLYMKRLGYEPHLAFVADCVRPGDTVVDIGANYGVYSLVLATRVGRTGRVIAFEPGREALLQLRENVALNHGLNVELVPLALSDHSGEQPLFHIGGPTTHSLSSFGGERTEVVRLTTLDTWEAGADLDRLDFIKVDVEGHEPQVFRGALTTLARYRPFILFEVSTGAMRRAHVRSSDTYTPLRSVGYEFFTLSGLRLIPSAADPVGNIFAMHPDSEWPDRLRNTIG
jgi:FkbM family methyltransferase